MFPSIMKYSALASFPLFGVVVMWLITTLKNVDYSQHTISRTIMLLKNPTHRLIYRASFIVKAVMDLIFAIYVIQDLRLFWLSPIGISLVLIPILFGSLAYYVEGEFDIAHKRLVYAFIILWGFCQISLSFVTQDLSFVLMTIVSSIIVGLLVLYYMYRNIANIYIQGFCTIMLYFWLFVFVTKYL
ncbi:MAG: hypothetical protein U0525_00120 [Patescibacteria group bacterium]